MENIAEIKSDELNYHKIAIANLEDNELQLRRWWHEKYNIPPKPLDDYRIEELYVEMLEDFYSENPRQLAEMKDKITFQNEPEWDGETTEEYEAAMAPWFEKNKIDISEFQSDEELTSEQEQAIIDSLGKPGPPAVIENHQQFEDDEFEETY